MLSTYLRQINGFNRCALRNWFPFQGGANLGPVGVPDICQQTF